MMLTKAALLIAAEALLPLMAHPDAYEFDPPLCNRPAHDWHIVTDKVVQWSDGYAKGTIEWAVAIECSHCDWFVGVG